MYYNIKINKRALLDIEKAIDYYKLQSDGLGSKFFKAVSEAIDSISLTPHFAVKYSDVRCLLVKKYMYMIHYQINEKKKIAVIRAVINTSRNPSSNWL
jgi:toxin ParE1/3/4